VRAFTDRAEALRWLEGVAPKNGATPSWWQPVGASVWSWRHSQARPARRRDP